MMNPVVVIATHVRKNITSRTIEQLQKGSVVPHIVIVCSRFDEYQYYSEKFEQVTVVIEQNEPLGRKWATGVRYAANHFKADPLIILGSDDLLNGEYIENACRIMERQKIDFLGITEWWILDESTGIMHEMKYRNQNFALGGGRCFSQRLLQKCNFEIFDKSRNKLLDDKGNQVAKESGLPYLILENAHEKGLHIISIKGNWQTLNSAEAILRSTSCIQTNQFEDGQLKLKQLL